MLRIGIFGDICPIENKEPFRLSVDTDYVIGNLECPLTDKPHPIKKVGPVLFNPTSFATYLKHFGVSALSLANNHIRDCGDEGIKSTIAACKSNGIQVFGAGENLETAGCPLVLEGSGKKVAFLSFAEKEFNYVAEGKAGAAVFDPYYSLDIISATKKSVDAVVVLYHGGIEHYIYPSPELQKKCRKMIISGADVVLCQHSHCIGTRENYQHGEILYGQGNSVFGYRKGNERWNYGLITYINISDQGVSVNYDVLETDTDGSVSNTSAERFDAIMDRFERESEKIIDSKFIKEEWRQFCYRQKSLYLPLLYGFGTNANRVNRLTNNRLIDILFSRRKKNVTHNIIRCDAHREVLETIFDEYDY